MKFFRSERRMVWSVLFAVLCTTSGSGVFGADDEGKSSNSTTRAAGKPESPLPPLTERERELLDQQRWMLERMVELEKRVAELEAKQAKADKPDQVTAGTGGKPTSVVPGATSPEGVNISSPAGSTPVQAAASANWSGSAVNPNPGQANDKARTSGQAAGKEARIEPFSDADWTWLNGNPRTKEIFWDTKFFTPEIRADVHYVANFNHPTDHSMGGSSELFRSFEVQLEQFGVGGDFHYDNVRARLMTQFGMYSSTTPRNDPSPGHGQ